MRNFLTTIILLFGFTTQAAVFQGPVSVLASNVVGTLVAPSNFLHTNITAGTNIVIVPSGPNGRGVTIHGTVLPGGGTNTLFQTNGVNVGSAGTLNWTTGVTGYLAGAVANLGVSVSGGGGGGLTTNANQFAGAPLSIKAAVRMTNVNLFGDTTNTSPIYLGGPGGSQIYSYDNIGAQYRLMFVSGTQTLAYGTNDHTHDWRGVAFKPQTDAVTTFGDQTHRWLDGWFKNSLNVSGNMFASTNVVASNSVTATMNLLLPYLPSNTVPVVGLGSAVTNAFKHYFYDTNSAPNLSNLVALAVSGDVVELGSGHFNLLAQNIYVPVGVTLRGQGAWSTILSGTNEFSGTPMVIVHSSNVIERLQIQAGNRVNYIQVMLGNDQNDATGTTYATNVVLRDLLIDGETDCVIIGGSAASGSWSGVIEDCDIRSKWDVLILQDTTHNLTMSQNWKVRRTRMIADTTGITYTGAIGIAAPIRLREAMVDFIDCEVIATNGSSVTLALTVDSSATNHVLISGGRWEAAGTAGLVAALWNENSTLGDTPQVAPIFVYGVGLNASNGSAASIISFVPYEASHLSARGIKFTGGQITNRFAYLGAETNVSFGAFGPGLIFSSGLLSTDPILTNLIGTVARNVTNVISLSTTNATSKPLTSSYTAGALTLFGIGQGSGQVITMSSNIVIANDWLQTASTTNVVGVSNWVNGVSNLVATKQQGDAVLTNLVGTSGRNVTNVVSLSTTNATSKPLTNSYTAGVLTLFGLEAGANVSLAPNGSNIIITGSMSLSTNSSQFGAQVMLTLRDGVTVTNLNNVGVLNFTNPPGATPKARLWQTNGLAYTELTVPSQWLPTNSLILSLTNVTAGQVLKVNSVSISGGIASIILTNDTDLSGGGGLQTNENQFGASVVLTIKNGPWFTNVNHVGVLSLTNPPGSGSPELRLWQTNGLAYNSFSTPDLWLPTNKFVLSVTNPSAGQVLKILSTSIAGGVNTIVLTNDTDLTGAGVATTNFDSIRVTNQMLYVPQVFNGSNGVSGIALTNNWDLSLGTFKQITNRVGTNLTFNLSNVIQSASVITTFRGIGAGSYSNTVTLLSPGNTGTNITWLNWATNGNYDILIRPAFTYTLQLFADTQTNVNAWVATDDPFVHILSPLIDNSIHYANSTNTTNIVIQQSIGQAVPMLSIRGSNNAPILEIDNRGFLILTNSLTNYNLGGTHRSPANTIAVGMEDIAGFKVPAWFKDTKLGYAVSPARWSSRTYTLFPSAGTTVGAEGITTANTGGTTVSHPAPTETFPYMIKVDSAATSNSSGGVSMTVNLASTGAHNGASRMNGYFFFTEWMITNKIAGIVGGGAPRFFIGLANSATPNLTNIVQTTNATGEYIGLMGDPKQSLNMFITSRDGSAEFRTNTGVNFVASNLYSFALYASPTSRFVGWRVSDMQARVMASGVFSNNVSTNLMKGTALTKNGTNRANEIFFGKMYLQAPLTPQ